MLQIVALLTDDSRGVIYGCNMFIVQARVPVLTKKSFIALAGGVEFHILYYLPVL